MKKILIAALLSLAAFTASAQAAQQCQCTVGSACTVVADIPARSDNAVPVSCTLKENGNTVGTANVVLTSTLPSGGTAACTPPSPGPAGSTYSCAVGGIAYPVGTHNVTYTVNYATAPLAVGPSATYTFDSIATLPVGNPALNVRIK